MDAQKKIFITGGTGFLGKRLENALLEQGYEVMIFTRNPKKPNHVSYNLSQSELIEKINDSYAVINLAGAPIIGKRWTEEYKKELYDSRINITKQFSEIISLCKTPPLIFISASAIGFYNDHGDDWINEKTEVGNSFISKLCEDWEQATLSAKAKTNVFIPRIGVVLDRGFGALKQMELPFKLYVGGPVGSGKQWLSWIDIIDLVNGILFALDKKLSGTANFTAPNPTTMNDFSKIYGKVLGRPSIFRVPSWILKIVLGEAAQEVLRSQRIKPNYLLDRGFTFKHELLESSLKKIYSK